MEWSSPNPFEIICLVRLHPRSGKNEEPPDLWGYQEAMHIGHSGLWKTYSTCPPPGLALALRVVGVEQEGISPAAITSSHLE